MAPRLRSPSGAKACAESVLSHSRTIPTFNFSPFLLQTYRLGLPADRPICRAYLSGHCPNGTACLDRHVSDPGAVAQANANGNTGNSKSGAGGNFAAGGPNSLVCKHWLRGLCKKGEQCEFLHEYNLRKMPECNFFVRNGFCSNGEECLYLHVDPRSKLPPCPAYERGFCPLGPNCGKKHVRRRVCLLYLAGFCPEGPACRAGSHPKWKGDAELQREAQEEQEAESQRNAHLASGGIPGMGMIDDQSQQQDDEMSLAGKDDRDGQRDRGMRDRDRDDGGRGRHGRGAKWRGKGDRKWRGRGGH